MRSLKPDEIQFIQRERGKMSVRQMARQLNVSRPEIENYLAKLSQEPSEKHQGVRTKTKKSVLLGSLLICVVTVLAFANNFGNEFVWDDQQMIVKDPTIENLSTLPKALAKPIGYYGSEKKKGFLWRPTTTFSFFADVQIWGKRPFGFHLTNLLLHLTTVVLLFVFLRRIWPRGRWAFLVALLYAVHPVNVEPVTAINGRHSMLAASFALVAVLSYRKSLVISILSSLLAFYSRETAVMLPLAIVAYDRFILGEKDYRLASVLKRYGPYVAVAALYFLSRFFFLGQLGAAAEGDTSSGYYSLMNRLWIQPVYFGEYLKMIFWPFGLHFWRQLYFPRTFFEPAYFVPFLTFLVLVAAAIGSYRKSRVAFFGFLWFIIFLFPVLNLVIVVNSPVLEHWLYLPLMGFLIFAVQILLDVMIRENRNRSKYFEAFFVLTIILLIPLTWKQNQTWKDEKTFFEYTTRFVTRDPLLYTNLGVAYCQANENDKARKAFMKALELDPEFQDARTNLKILENHIRRDQKNRSAKSL